MSTASCITVSRVNMFGQSWLQWNLKAVGNRLTVHSVALMSKNRKSKPKPPTEQKPLIEIPEDEKWRLIRQSGLLERFKDSDLPSTSSSAPTRPVTTSEEGLDGPPPLAEEILNALMLIMPHTFFLVMMDM